MKFSVPLLASLAVIGFAKATQPMLRASAITPSVRRVTTTGINGSIDSQIILEGPGITHEITRSERVMIQNCLMSSYNVAYTGATGYAMSAVSTASASTMFSHGTTSNATATSGSYVKNQYPYNGMILTVDWNCTSCAAGKYVPPLDTTVLPLMETCMVAHNYTASQVSVSFFAPAINNSYASGPAPVLLGSTIQMQSDISLYGISSELSDTADGVVATCFTNKYNQQYSSGDWNVTGFGIKLETVLNSGTTSVYLLMNVFVSYTCNACNQPQPLDTTANHAAFETLLTSCLTRSGSRSFGNLNHATVRNMAVSAF